jgi:hypothetical protein
VRRPSGSFGWLPVVLLHEGWLARLGPNATAVLVLLALAADGRGASFYGRERMAERLGLGRAELDRALARLLELGLVALRPWRSGTEDGVWQLRPLPCERRERGSRGHLPIGAILAQLGFEP